MAGKERNGVFISYATGDGTAFAEGLRTALTTNKIDVWQDVIKLRGGDNWWQQIVEAITSVNYVLMVLTPLALERATVQKEWRLARQEGVRVLPILASPDVPIERLPRWMQKIQLYRLGFDPTQLDQAKNWALFLNDIQTGYEPKRRPFMADDRGIFVDRPAEYGELIENLIDRDKTEPKPVTHALALRGAGGYGKTTLARAICHDEQVQEAFDDGILWVTLGESATIDTVRAQIDSLIAVIGGERFDAPTLEAAKTRLRELLEDRDMLMVIDDVWHADHARPFLEGGNRVARLITTRMGDSLPASARKIDVNRMTQEEALALIAYGMPRTAVTPERAALVRLAEQLGEQPLLLKLANGILLNRTEKRGIGGAIEYLSELYDEYGIGLGDRQNQIAAAINASIRQLTPDERTFYEKLTIFPEDADIPLATLARWWAVRPIRAERLCEMLVGFSLLLQYDETAQTIRLHDVIRKHLVENAAGLSDMHARFLSAYSLNVWAELPYDEPYLWDRLAYHLIEAGQGGVLINTVLDLRYLARKTILKGTASVEQDHAAAARFAEQHDHPQRAALALLERNYRNMVHILRRCESMHDALITLHARLNHLDALKSSCAAVESDLKPPYITKGLSLPDLPHPALIRTLTGHTRLVNSAAVSPEGRWIVSASDDNTIKVWVTETGEDRLTLTDHADSVNSAAFSPDGQWIVSASNDNTVQVWDAGTGAHHLTLTGHTNGVYSAAFSPDGRWIVSASSDKTIKVWDSETGMERLTLTGHTKSVNSAVFSPDGRWIVSAAEDRTVKVWSAETGAERFTLTGHTGRVKSAAFSPNGKRIVSASADRTVRVWNAETGAKRLILTGHKSEVNSAVFSPDGQYVISSSMDRPIKVWNAETGAEQLTLTGHTHVVNSAVFSPDGQRIVSASRDKTIKVWDTSLLSPSQFETDPTHLAVTGHTSDVNSVAFSPDGQWIVSASEDKTIKIWDVETGAERLTHTGHNSFVNSTAFSPDGRWIISASRDTTLKIWDAITPSESGECEAARTLNGHTSSVNSAVFSPNGQSIISTSNDQTLKLWDSETGIERLTLKGHTSSVNSAAFSPDGQWIVSASWDKTLKVWNYQTGAERHTLIGHTKRVMSAVFSTDGSRIVSASADLTIRVWDTETGTEQVTLTGHTNTVGSAAFSLDGRWIISASWDKTIKLWNAATGICCATFYADAPLNCCAWSPDKRLIIAGGGGGYLYWLRWVE